MSMQHYVDSTQSYALFSRTTFNPSNIYLNTYADWLNKFGFDYISFSHVEYAFLNNVEAELAWINERKTFWENLWGNSYNILLENMVVNSDDSYSYSITTLKFNPDFSTIVSPTNSGGIHTLYSMPFVTRSYDIETSLPNSISIAKEIILRYFEKEK